MIVDSGNFDWTNGKFPDLTEPDEFYHGISYTEIYGKKAYIVKARMQFMRDFGVYPAAHFAFLLNLGLETLAVRMKQYCENLTSVVDLTSIRLYVIMEVLQANRKRCIYTPLFDCNLCNTEFSRNFHFFLE